MGRKSKRLSKSIMMEELPYGRRVFDDGTEELFNRRYETIRRRGPGKSTVQVLQKFFYTDQNPPWEDDHVKSQCETALNIWRAE
ncbi:hypothetical protein DLM86_00900 [Paenibacillus flagellatus]|uniref:Uncharacterized protein n=1 Tax=Paenibacillus flagellatus TaxID=2211139 RepID=A0A2V5KBT7_9BACL|nr:hypothetical protein DLM86_00900 [Paenibacillus flagellatus]